VYTFGQGWPGKLGHGGEEGEPVPRVVEALAGQKVVGAAAGTAHTVVWTEGGEVYTFGYGASGRLGHGGGENARVPRVVEALAGKQVVGASAGVSHTVVWTEGGEVYTFGGGLHGKLGHGGEGEELVPRVVEALWV
jgi:RCC1 and BTB domain-containing protein